METHQIYYQIFGYQLAEIQIKNGLKECECI